MEQNKVTQSQRKALKALSEEDRYMIAGDWRRSSCMIYGPSEGLVCECHFSTFNFLDNEGLINREAKGIYTITELGRDAAIKGSYET